MTIDRHTDRQTDSLTAAQTTCVMTRANAKKYIRTAAATATTMAGIMSTITDKANQTQRVTCAQHFESVTIIALANKKVNKLWQQ